MHKNFRRDIWLTFGFVFMLGLFFQLNRMDVFLHISSWRNYNLASIQKEWTEFTMQHLPRERYLIIYDPLDVQSVLTNHNVAKILSEQKKEVVSKSLTQVSDADIAGQGIIIATNKLSMLNCLPQIEHYVEQGGRAIVMKRLEAGYTPPELLQGLGVQSMGSDVYAIGINIKGDIYLGLQGITLRDPAYNNVLTDVKLADDCQLEITSSEGIPMVWSHASGQGRYYVWNCNERDDKLNFGIQTVLLSQLQEDYVYPVVAAKVFFIDDFPSPVPEGSFDKIYEETGLSTEDFYRKIWWPDMLANAEKYDLKYTGLIIESYGNQVKGPFEPLPGRDARNNLIIYGRELLKAGGELGIHGYNHQSLAPAGWADKEGYNPWSSQEDMEESLQELKRYVEDVYPGYVIQTYVPPSNIISPEGKRAVKAVFTDLKTYASLFDGPAADTQYLQNYGRNEDGTYEFPRVSSGHSPEESEVWLAYNVINYMGIFSHFLHPDELFYEESEHLTWAMMQHDLDVMLGDIGTRFPWLRSMTASECIDYFADYLDMDYRLERDKAGIRLHSWNFNHPMCFVLRSHKDIASMSGGTFQKIQADAYILTIQEPEVEIQWAGE